MGSRVLIVGMGAREHAIAWKLRQSSGVDEIFVAPGNGGTASVATNLPVKPTDIDGLCKAARDLHVDFYLATMDDPQPLGLVDRLTAQGVLCYGPTQAAARLESSKAWAKQFMRDHGIRTAAGESFSAYRDACAFIDAQPEGAVWVKASGLAAGKGAIGCATRAEAVAALDQLMVQRAFGAAGDEVVIEQDLRGWETSAHAFCDGKTAKLMPFASDYKRANDGGEGLNTGGMGAYSPSAPVTDDVAGTVQSDVVDRVLAGMAGLGAPYCGTLFPGLMVTGDGIYVLEFNARFGDPETQPLMMRLESDLFTVCSAAAVGMLASTDIQWSAEPAVGVVMASGGYPGTYATGFPIHGLDTLDAGVMAFHAGTKLVDGQVVTAGGRVLTVVARGATVAEARARAYDNVRRISFQDMHVRTDIAAEA